MGIFWRDCRAGGLRTQQQQASRPRALRGHGHHRPPIAAPPRLARQRARLHEHGATVQGDAARAQEAVATTVGDLSASAYRREAAWRLMRKMRPGGVLLL